VQTQGKRQRAEGTVTSDGPVVSVTEYNDCWFRYFHALLQLFVLYILVKEWVTLQ
jgi:hypothetical protein